MKNLKNKIKNMKGITLISLVITIIVLIILAGVTINMLLGENGIINRTKTARDENEKATATETMNLKITNVQISKYAEEQRMPTLKELADNFCEDDDFQYVQETSEVASLTKITNNNPTSIYTKLKAYPYEFEINSSLQLASIDGVKVASIPENDGDSIVSMTKSELNSYIESAINTKLQEYSKTTDISSTYATKTQVENIENSEMCSTTEKRVGTYLNNKPLYQRTFTGTLGTINTDTIVNSNANNIDKLFLINGCVVKSGYIATLPYCYDGAIFMSVLKNDNNNIAINYSSSNTFYEGGTYYLTVQYTKTTD